MYTTFVWPKQDRSSFSHWRKTFRCSTSPIGLTFINGRYLMKLFWRWNCTLSTILKCWLCPMLTLCVCFKLTNPSQYAYSSSTPQSSNLVSFSWMTATTRPGTLVTSRCGWLTTSKNWSRSNSTNKSITRSRKTKSYTK